MSDLTFEEHPGDAEGLPRHWVVDAVWGSPGGLQYEHKTFEWNSRSRVFVARRGNEILGMHVWLPFDWGFLRHMIIVHPDHQGQGIAKALMRAGRAHFSAQLGPEQMIAGIVDQTHATSMHLSEIAGYDVVGAFDLITFSRRFSERDPRVRRATEDEISDLVPIHLARAGRSWSDFEAQATPQNTWVFEDAGEVRSGATVVSHHIALKSLGLGFADRPVLSAMPMLIQNARSDDYRPISLHYCWGDVSTFGALWESLLSEARTGAATVGFDTEDPLYHDLRACLNVGIMGKLVGPVRWAVTAAGRPSARPWAWPAENR